MIADKYERFRPDLNFIKRYWDAQNAATGSEYDPNSNVSSKNNATLAAETGKRARIYTKRLAMWEKIRDLFGEDVADNYIDDLESHRIYCHDETSVIGMPYCASITLYPFLMNGLKGLGGTSSAPKHLDSFAGSFINLVFAASAQVAGAIATPEFLPYLNYFLVKEYGKDYHLNSGFVVDHSTRKRTIEEKIEDVFAQVVYSINQPAAARGNQSVFWNVAYFDKPYYHALFEDFVFPDGTLMTDLWDSYWELQCRFMKWFNRERTRKPLTFPVESFSLLNDGKDCVDQVAKDFVCEMQAEGHSFFVYTSDSVDSLASCCRLRNGITENTFSYSLGAGGIATGSKCVMTINVNRLVQDALNQDVCQEGEGIIDMIRRRLETQVKRVHKYLTAFNAIIKDAQANHMIPLYDAGFVSPEKQYLTIGINGFVEGAESIGMEIDDNDTYELYAETILGTIFDLNKAAKTDEIMFNTEFVPAESLGVKNAQWDKHDGYDVPRDCYNSYFYKVEDDSLNVLDKFKLYSRKFTERLDGGSALHMNLKEHLTKEQYAKLLEVAIEQGCTYFTYNIPNTICDDCGHISKHYVTECPVCHSQNVDYLTRVIGFLVRVSKMSASRQAEAKKRFYA